MNEWNWRLCEWTCAYVCINCQILTGGNQNISMGITCSVSTTTKTQTFGESQLIKWHGFYGIFDINTACDISKLLLAEAACDIKDTFEISQAVFMHKCILILHSFNTVIIPPNLHSMSQMAHCTCINWHKPWKPLHNSVSYLMDWFQGRWNTGLYTAWREHGWIQTKSWRDMVTLL